MLLQETRRAFGVLTDRAQGGGNVVPGMIELMVHRRTMQDDGLGVAEPLREVGVDGRGLVVRGTHSLWVSAPENAAYMYRRRSLELHMQPVMTFYDSNQYRNTAQPNRYSALQESLPNNIHLLTLENWDANSKLLRLEHIYQSKEAAKYSQPAVVQLRVRINRIL